MSDDRKTKVELIEEISILRERVAALERELAPVRNLWGQQSSSKVERPTRQDIRTHIEFIADFDVIEARAVNISEGGICFSMDEDLPFEMRFELDGRIHQHRGHLVWVKRIPNEGCQFGIMFTRPERRESF